MVQGTLTLSRYKNGIFSMVFAPHDWRGNPVPMVGKEKGRVESDLVSMFAFTPPKAHQTVSDLVARGQVELTVAVDEDTASHLFRPR